MSRQSVSTIMFDLGGVLFELSGAATICQWTRERLTPEQLLERWLASPAVRSFESGRIDFPAFRDRLREELGLMMSDDDFAGAFSAWVTGTYPGAESLLRELTGRYRLACFSNTNEFHWDILERDYRVLPLFERIFASFQMGLVKPDPEAFGYVLDALDRPADSIVFLDDSQPNVDAANACGLRAFRVSGVDGVRRALNALELL